MKRSHLLFSCALALSVGAAAAQVKAFLQVPNVPGESVDESHKGWIDLSTVSVGVADRACTGVTVTKNLDTSSPLLSGAALNGSVYPVMTVDVARSTDGRAEVFLTYALENVMVAAVQATSTALVPVTEVVLLAPARITMVYRPPSGGAVSYPLTCPKK